MELILASASPRRLALLEQIGQVPSQVLAADLDETPHPRELPRRYAIRLADEKAVAVRDAHQLTKPGQVILAADTVVALGRRILPKAEDAQTVRECLALLSGRAHQVHCAVTLLTGAGQMTRRCVSSRVSVKRLTKADIEGYVDGGEGLGKAGGYAIQGHAAAFIRQIAGSYSGIVGLPLFEVSQMLHGLAVK
ncbi:MAG: septum formation protein Maf [Alphaproteobacteria bacterium]|nr:septum formation protein Maf [Alphaproteobacteria bacterium SS10]